MHYRVSYIGVSCLDPHSKVGGVRAIAPMVNMKEMSLRKTGVSRLMSGEDPGSAESSVHCSKESGTSESCGTICISNLQDMQPNRRCIGLLASSHLQRSCLYSPGGKVYRRRYLGCSGFGCKDQSQAPASTPFLGSEGVDVLLPTHWRSTNHIHFSLLGPSGQRPQPLIPSRKLWLDEKSCMSKESQGLLDLSLLGITNL